MSDRLPVVMDAQSTYMSGWFRKNWAFIIIILLFLAWIIMLGYAGPEVIVGSIGVENTYGAAFLMAAIGGISSLTGASFFVAIATFSAGGANPIFLAFAGGIGIFISDSIFYFIAKRVTHTFGFVLSRPVFKLRRWIEKRPDWMVMSASYAYLGFSPLPSDLLMVALVLAGVRYRRIAPVLFVGGFTVVLLTAYLGRLFL